MVAANAKTPVTKIKPNECDECFGKIAAANGKYMNPTTRSDQCGLYKSKFLQYGQERAPFSGRKRLCPGTGTVRIIRHFNDLPQFGQL